MSNGIATFDDQEINNMLEEIKKNPSTRNELNNILRVFPPKGLYNRNTGRLSVYE